MTDFGYGVDLSTSKVQWRAGYQKIVYEQAVKHEDLRVNWEDFCCDKDPSLPADEESIAEWVDTYEDDTGNWSGAEGLLAAIINLDKFDGEGIFAYEDQCLFVPARIPVDNADRLKWPTIREIQSILAEYLNPLLTEPVATEYLTINN